jgi:hypothetical protein
MKVGDAEVSALYKIDVLCQAREEYRVFCLVSGRDGYCRSYAMVLSTISPAAVIPFCVTISTFPSSNKLIVITITTWPFRLSVRSILMGLV